MHIMYCMFVHVGLSYWGNTYIKMHVDLPVIPINSGLCGALIKGTTRTLAGKDVTTAGNDNSSFSDVLVLCVTASIAFWQ